MPRDYKEYTILNAVTPQTLTSSTDATPIVVTKTAHGLTTGQNILIFGHTTNIAANGITTITVLTANTFSLQDPYTGREIQFMRGADTSDDVQIDHVVALSDAWQKGAQNLTTDQRELFANDPLELLAVEGKANQTKSDSDAASWLPANKSFRCQYVARQVAVKAKYQLWMTQAEYDTVKRVLDSCPGQPLPAV